MSIINSIMHHGSRNDMETDEMGKKVLLTGGAGFIGSHTAVELIESGYDVVIADDLSNSERSVIGRIEKITGKSPEFYEADVADKNALRRIFEDAEQKSTDIDAVIHFAGYKAVGESVEKPLMYYRNNLDATLTLLEVMQEVWCEKIHLQFVGNCIQSGTRSAVHRGNTASGMHESVRMDQIYDRTDPAGCLCGGSGYVGRAAQIFQPDRRTRVRTYRGEAEWYPEQSDALYNASGTGDQTTAERIWR